MTDGKNISIKKATIINAGSKYTVVVWNLILTAILARLLSPEDYGIVAVTTVFTNFFTLFADMGLGTGIIQNKTLTRDETNDIFSFSFYIGIVLAILFCLFSIPISIFYKNDVYKPIGILLSLSLLFTTLNMVPNAILMKDKQFIKVAVRNIVVPVVTSILAVIMAVAGWKYYALVWQSVLTNIITFVWNFATVKKFYGLKFHIRFGKSGLKKIMSFSGYQFAFSFVNYFARNLDNLLTSRFMGEKALGYYDKAYKLMLYPVGNLTHVITPVLHPILSDYQNDKEYIYKQYMKVIHILSALGVFITPFCFFASEEIILIMYGENWRASIPCFTALSLSVWTQMITSSTGSIFQSTGNTKAMLKSCIINTIISIIAIIMGIMDGKIESVAVYVSIAYNIHFILTFCILMKEAMQIRFVRFFKEIYIDIIFLIILILAGYFWIWDISGFNMWIRVIIKALYLGSIYLLYLFITGKYKIFKQLFFKANKK